MKRVPFTGSEKESLHIIEETARHAGHMDIMRELIDGRTGDHPGAKDAE